MSSMTYNRIIPQDRRLIRERSLSCQTRLTIYWPESTIPKIGVRYENLGVGELSEHPQFLWTKFINRIKTYNIGLDYFSDRDFSLHFSVRYMRSVLFIATSKDLWKCLIQNKCELVVEYSYNEWMNESL